VLGAEVWVKLVDADAPRRPTPPRSRFWAWAGGRASAPSSRWSRGVKPTS